MFFKNMIEKVKSSYRHRLSWLFSIAILVPLFIVFIFGIVFFTNQSEQIVNDQIKIQENSIAKKLDDTFNSLYNKMFYLINLNALYDTLNVDNPLTISGQFELNDNMNMMDMFFPADSTEKITIYTTNPYIKNPKYIVKTTDEAINSMVESDDVITKIEYKENAWQFSIYKLYPRSSNHKSLFCISVPVSKIFLDDKYALSNGFFVYYKNGEDETVSITVSDIIDVPDVNEYIKNGNLSHFAVSELKVPFVDGMFYIFKDTKTESLETTAIILLFVFVFALITLSVLLLVNILTKTLTNMLTSIILEIEVDDIKAPTVTKNKVNEFYIIHNKLYDLTCNLREENDRILKIEAELLNQKISPHFLYNNLSAIKWSYNDEKLENVIDILTTYYRNIFHKSSSFIMLEEELDNLKIYVSLLKFAYEQDFKYEVYFSDEVRTLTMLSNLLQPLLENSFLHSINNSDEDTSFIKVKAEKQDESLVVEVINNHCFESADRLNEIANDKNEESSALPIIQKRIKLFYGEDYGLSFEKEDDVLTARIILPIVD